MHKETRHISTKQIVTMALLIALTTVSTMLIKIPTPSLGYIHPGDGFVLLCGLLLGPIPGAICAGLGSALADLFSGYMIYVPATFIIKALCAYLCGIIFNHFKKTDKNTALGIILGGIVGEFFMVIGYFIYEVFMVGVTVGASAALAGVPFNLIQGAFGVIFASILYPIIAPAYRKVIAS